MDPRDHAACIEACDQAATACAHCAAVCLAEPDVKQLARCIALTLDGAALCRLASGFMARGSPAAAMVAGACAGLCEQVAIECARHPREACLTAAQACRECAQACTS